MQSLPTVSFVFLLHCFDCCSAFSAVFFFSVKHGGESGRTAFMWNQRMTTDATDANGVRLSLDFPFFFPHRVSCCFLLPFLLFVVLLLMIRLTYAPCGIFGHFETLSACQRFLPRSMQSPNVIYCVILVYSTKAARAPAAFAIACPPPTALFCYILIYIIILPEYQ